MALSANASIAMEETRYPSVIFRWGVVVLLSLAALLSYGDRSIINLVATDIRRELALTEFSVSLLMGSGFAVLYAFFGVPVGRIADRFSRRNLVIAGIALWCAATVACGAATSFLELFVARMFVGLGEAALMPAATSLIADSFPPRERGRAFSTFHIGAVLGSGLSLGLGGLLLSSVQHGLLANVPLVQSLTPWRSVLLLAGLPGIPLCLLLLCVQEPERQGLRGARRLGELARVSLAHQGRVARICLAVGLVAAGDYGLLSWLPAVLERSYGIGPGTGGQIIGLMVAGGGLAGCLAGGWLADYFTRLGGLPARIRVVRLGYGVCLASLPLFLFPAAGAVLAGTAVWVLGSVGSFVVANVYLSEAVANEYRATVVALSNICSALIGMGLGPTLAVFLARLMPPGHDSGLQLGVASLGAVSAFTALALLAWRRAPAGPR
jgi:MFS family permease